MYILLSKNSFVRTLPNSDCVLISNQLSKGMKLYQGSASDFLLALQRHPVAVEDIINRLCEEYGEENRELISTDFSAMMNDLRKDNYVILRETAEECMAADPHFTYAVENYKPKSETLLNGDPIETCPVPDELLDADRRNPRITNLEFEITSRCNERCIHCYIPNGKKNRGVDMPFEKFKAIIDQFADMGGLHVTLSGGEALLHRDILRMLDYCREKDLQISLLTNLALLKAEQIKPLHDVNLSLIQVSLYSMNSEIHDTVTAVKGSFKATIAAIEALHAADVPLQINCPVMKANKDCYRDVLRYAQSLNIKSNCDYVIMAQSNCDTENLANRLSVAETGNVIREVMEGDRDYQEMLDEMRPISSLSTQELCEMPVCGAGTTDACVTVNGDIYPCAGWQGLVAGNVYRQSLREIWENSPVFKKVRAVRYKDFPKCMKCDARDYCNLCMVRNYNESGGDMFKINKHFCDVAHLNKKIVEEYRKAKRK